jgi:hypothetical protein
MWRKLCLSVAMVSTVMLTVVPMAEAQRGPDRDYYEESEQRRSWWQRWRRGAGPKQAHWEVLGAQTVSLFGRDRDVIQVGRKEGRFSALKLRVARNDVFVNRVIVRFGNGEEQEINLRKVVPQGSESEPLDLDGDQRFIDSVELHYRSRPGSRQEAVVELLGLEGDPFRGLAGQRPGAPKWELLGEKAADFRPDRDVIAVGRGEGRFSRLRIKVLRHDVDFDSIDVIYLNGQADRYDIRRKVRDEEPGFDIDLRGERRGIREIVMRYKSRLNLKGQAVVQVYGLQ